MINALKQMLQTRYRESQYPALKRQMDEWICHRPLEGIKVLDATPVFFNTGLKYLALLLGGADLTVCAHKQLPFDPKAVSFFTSIGLRVISAPSDQDKWDVICDCAGNLRTAATNFGVVELTGSGRCRYQNHPQPVFLADGGKIKIIETGLGTGDGVLRALDQLGYEFGSGQSAVLFGGGKVGCGVALGP